MGTETILTPLTDYSSEFYPAVSENLVVWLDQPSDKVDLHFYDMSNGEESIIWTSETSDIPNVAISGQTVVWDEIDADTGRYMIQIYDGTVQEPPLFDGMSPVQAPMPRIDGSNVVWQVFNESGNTYEIILYNSAGFTTIETGITPQVPPFPDVSDSASGAWIVWQSYNDSASGYDIWLYDTTSSSSSLIVTVGNYSSDPFYYPYPRISAEPELYLVWQDYRLDDDQFSIVLYKGDLGISSVVASKNALTSAPPHLWSPLISGTRLAWVDYLDPSQDVIYYSIPRDELSIIPLDENQEQLDISGSRLVWKDSRGLSNDIYSFTIDVTETCPLANFTFALQEGPEPFTFEFTDTTVPSPETWWWNFGDGNISDDQNPVHRYSTPDVFTVRLNVSTLFCRHAIAKEVSAGTPFANFTVDHQAGYVPCTVQFSDTSLGAPDTYLWDFGDGNSSSEQNPVHTFFTGGSYDISLTVNNSYGASSLTRNDFIAVFERTGEVVRTNISGLMIMDGGVPQIMVHTADVARWTLLNSTHFRIEPVAGFGVAELLFISPEGGQFTEDNGVVTGPIERVLLTSNPIPLFNLGEGIGPTASAQYQLTIDGYPEDATITAYLYPGGIASDVRMINRAAFDSNHGRVWDTAYELEFITTDLNNPYTATLNVSVNSSWVVHHLDTHGTKNLIRLVRMGQEEVYLLPTSFTINDTTSNLDYFTATSPYGLSRFVLVAFYKTGNPLQIFVLSVRARFDSGGDGGDSPPPPPATTAVPTSPALPVSPLANISTGGIGSLLTDERGTLTAPVSVSAGDGIATLSLVQGTIALDTHGKPLKEVQIIPLREEDFSLYLNRSEGRFEGLAYQLLPDGALFSPPLLITFTIPVFFEMEGREYFLMVVDESGSWEMLSADLNTNQRILNATIYHFSSIALFSRDVPVHATETIHTTPSMLTARPTATSLPVILPIVSFLLYFILTILHTRKK